MAAAAQPSGSAEGGRLAPPKPLRIVHIFRSPVGGLFRHVVDLVEAQHKAGHKVGILCDSTSGNGGEVAVFERLGPALELGLLRVPMQRSVGLSDVRAAWTLKNDVAALEPDVLHGHGAKGGAYARAIGTRLRRAKIPVARIYTPHGGSLHYDKGSLSGRLYLGAERLLARMTDAFIFVSEFERDAFLTKVGKTNKPMTVVHNGLRPEEFAPVTPAPGARDFLFIGELRDLKGPDVFIGAIALLGHRSGKPPSAVIVGSGPDEQKYRTVVEQLGLNGAIEFRGPMPAREAMTLAKTVVVPSRAESMPYIVLETIAAGMPMVVTHVGGIPEIFGADSGRLVPPGDAAALADAMAAILTAPGAALAKAAAHNIRIRSEFTVEAMAATVENVYRSVTAR